MRKALLATLFCVCSGSASAQAIGAHVATAAKATDQSASIAALAKAVDSLSERVGKLETNSLNLGALFTAGSYSWSGFQVGLGKSVVETISFNGTIVFSADGTVTAHLTNQSSDLGTGGAAKPTSSLQVEDASGTWTVSGNTLTVTTTDGTVLTFLGASANQVLVGVITNNHATGTLFDKQIVILTRDKQLL